MSSLREDLALIGKVSEPQLNNVIDFLTQPNSDSSDWALYLEAVPDNLRAPANALISILNYVAEAYFRSRVYETARQELDEFITQVVASDELAQQGWNIVKSSHDSLVPFFKKKKEEVLKSKFSSVSDLSITVDARPVYSFDKTSIDKYIYPLILSIQTNDDKTLVCEFYEEFLDQIQSEIDMARSKLNALKSSLK